MNNTFRTKFLQHLSAKKQNKGFTLIELLVVVIIIGILAAVALPNLLKQVGKSRETEIKNAVGTVNRNQNAFHFEKRAFRPAATLAATGGAITDTLLGITFDVEYADELVLASDTAQATVQARNTGFQNDGTRAYSGGVFYAGGEYSLIMCQSDDVAVDLVVPTGGNACAAGTDVQ